MAASWKRRAAQAMVEYALIVALLAVAAIVGLTALGPRLVPTFTSAGASIGAPAPSGPAAPGGF